MSLDGIWGIEILGLFGWETTGILVLENGRIIGGGNHHYSIGEYRQEGDDLNLSVSVTYHGAPRTLFGATDRVLNIVATLKADEQSMQGLAHRVDRPDNTMRCQLTKQADLPA